MLKIPFEAQEPDNSFRMQVPNPDDYRVGQSCAAQAVDPRGPYPVRATIEDKRGNEIAGTFVRT